MSILIKDMEMPVGCWWRDNLGLYRECPFFDRDHYCYKLNREVSDNYAKHPFDCPLIEVPTPHGRLIDEKWIKEYITDTTEGFEELIMNRNDLQYYSLIAGLRTVEVMIEHAPTVIEAEEGKE